MYKAKIRLAYRLIIDQTSTYLWDQYVWEDTFKEFVMQSQQFNSKEEPKNTFRALLSHNEKSSELHYLTGMAAQNYINQLNGNLYRVPDILGNNYLPFINYQLDIINSDITDSSKHKIGITFFSPLLALLDIIEGNYLISKTCEDASGYETFMYPLQPNLSICYYQKNASSECALQTF